MVTKAIRQGAATVLTATQLQIGVATNIRVAEQRFPPGSTDDDIASLIKSFEPASNTVLSKVDVELILHATLDP